MSWRTIRANVCRSRTRRAINCTDCAPKSMTRTGRSAGRGPSRDTSDPLNVVGVEAGQKPNIPGETTRENETPRRSQPSAHGGLAMVYRADLHRMLGAARGLPVEEVRFGSSDTGGQADGGIRIRRELLSFHRYSPFLVELSEESRNSFDLSAKQHQHRADRSRTGDGPWQTLNQHLRQRSLLRVQLVRPPARPSMSSAHARTRSLATLHRSCFLLDSSCW